MADIVLTVAGAAVGAYFGNWQLGMAVGNMLGSMLFPPKPEAIDTGTTDIQHLNSSYGAVIPYGRGRTRLAGTVVWATEIEHVESRSGGGKGKPDTIEHNYYVSLMIKFGAKRINKVTRIFANSKVIYENTSGTGYVAASPVEEHGTGAKWESYLNIDNIRIYLGDSDQPQDPLIVSILGASNTPAYRDCPCIMFERLPLNKFNRSIPNIEIETDEGTISLADFMDGLCDACEIGAEQRDFSELDDIPFIGAVVDSRTDIRSIVESAQTAYQFDVVGINGKVTGKKRSGYTPEVLDQSIIGVGVDSPAADPFQLRNSDEVGTVRQLNVSYISPAFDFQRLTQNAVRVGGEINEPRSIQLPFALEETAAKRIAIVLLFAADAQRLRLTVSCSYEALVFLPGMVFSLDLPEIGVRNFKIVEMSREHFGIINIVAHSEDPRVYTQTAIGTVIETPDTGIGGGDSILRVLDTGPADDFSSDYPSLVFVATGPGSNWKASVQTANTSGFAWSDSPKDWTGQFRSTVANLEERATLGKVVAPLPVNSEANITQAIDIFVELESGSLTGVTQEEFLAGKNVAVWGNEIIYFKDVAFVSGNKWKLSNILRGRRGTTWAMNHSVDEDFSTVPPNSLSLFAAHVSQHNESWDFILYENGVDYANRTPEKVTKQLVSNSAKALPVVYVGAERAGGDITLTWIRQDRKGFDWEDLVDIPMSESSLKFDVEIWSTNYGTLKRTKRVTSETAVYTSAEQTTDFGSPQTEVFVKIYQVQESKPWGRGHPSLFRG